ITNRTRRHAKRRFLREPDARATRLGMFPRKERENRAGMAFGVTVVEVIRTRVVEIHRFLDKAQAQDMRVEVEVACRLAGYCRHMMNSSHGRDPHTRNRRSSKNGVFASNCHWRPVQHKPYRWPCCSARAEVNRSQHLLMSALGQKRTFRYVR